MMKFSSSISWRRVGLYTLFAVFLLLLLMAFTTQASAEAPSSSTGFYYTVQWGDTLSVLAVRYGTTVYAISQANGIVNPNLIYAGRVLWIPTGYVAPEPPIAQCRAYHTVTWGDTLNRIGAWYGVSPWAIAQVNNIYNLNLIYRGQTLCIP